MKRDCHLIGEKIKSVSAGRERERVRHRRCSDSFIHAPHCGEAREKEPRRQRDSMRTGEGVEEISVCVWLCV